MAEKMIWSAEAEKYKHSRLVFHESRVEAITQATQKCLAAAKESFKEENGWEPDWTLPDWVEAVRTIEPDWQN